MRRWPTTGEAMVQAPAPAVLAAWRADETPFYAVVLVIRNPAVSTRRAETLRRLHPFGEATLGPSHVTLAAVGSILPDLSGLRGRRLSLSIGGGDTFESAAFLRVAGPGLSSLRAEVLQRVDNSLESRNWMPHLTVATYRWSVPLKVITPRLRPTAEWPAIPAAGVVELARVGKGRGAPLSIIR